MGLDCGCDLVDGDLDNGICGETCVQDASDIVYHNDSYCSQRWCVSGSEDDKVYDCWSRTGCRCSTGDARLTGERKKNAEDDSETVFEYTCCVGGDNKGEQCGTSADDQTYWYLLGAFGIVFLASAAASCCARNTGRGAPSGKSFRGAVVLRVEPAGSPPAAGPRQPR